MRLFKLKSRFWKAHNSVVKYLVIFGILKLVSPVTAQSCNGEITFEKLSGYILDLQNSPSTSALISHPGEVILNDCMTLCRNSSRCDAFNIDYAAGLCTSLQDVEGRRSSLRVNTGTSYFEKVCISGVSSSDYDALCHDRLWAFESIIGATFIDFEENPQIHRPVNRTECHRMCLMETQFNCRSAQYDSLTSTCRLSQETRWSQPAAFKTQQGTNYEYLENLCSLTTMSCHYEASHQDTTIIANEYKTRADGEEECQKICDESTFLICRSYSYNSYLIACFLSTEDSTIRALVPNPGYVYAERKCTSQCTEGIITYEKITGYRLRNAQSNPLGPQLTGNTGNCLTQCKTDQSPLCRSVHVDYTTGSCSRLDRDSQGDRQNELIPQLGVSYFEQVCLRGRTQTCGNKAWAFERVPKHEIREHDDKILPNVQSRIHCEEACIQETQFECRSAEYDRWNIVCRLSRQDRRTQPEAFVETIANDVEYLEYQCSTEYDVSTCEFVSVGQGLPRYVDSVIRDVESLQQCQDRCNSERMFQCRSLAYQMSNQECLLSGDDTISAGQRSFVPSQGAMYYERHCQLDIDNATITTDSTVPQTTEITLPFPFTPPTQEPFPGIPTSAPFPSGRCTGGLGKTEYERTAGYKITVELMLLHDGRGNFGITQECIIKCNVDPSCQGFVLDYLSNRCYTVENDPSLNRDLLQRGQSVAYYEPVCYQVSTGCGKLWTFERYIQKQLRVIARETIKGISKTDCEQRCLSAVQFLCRSANYDVERQECHLNAENRLTQSNSMLEDSIAFDYLENECYYQSGNINAAITRTDTGSNNNNPPIRQTTTEQINVHPRKSLSNCYYANEAASSRLSYVERTVNVATEFDCRRACDIEITFNCRSYSFITVGFSGSQCYLSADTRNSLGAEIRTVAGSSYAERICSQNVPPFPNPNPFPIPITPVPYPRPFPPDKGYYPPPPPLHPPPGLPGLPSPYQPPNFGPYPMPYPQYPGPYQTPYSPNVYPSNPDTAPATLRDGQQYPLPGPTAYLGPTNCLDLDITFERITKLANQGFGSEVRISLEHQPSLDCLRECLAFGDQCQSITFKSNFQGYSTPCTVYSTPSGGGLTPPMIDPSSAYFQKICLAGGRCDKAWSFERVPFYYLEGYDDLELVNINTKEECETACLQQTTSPCRSAEYFYGKATCRLSRETRRSQPYAFQYFGDGVEYFENQCNPEPGFCGFVDFPNKFLPYFDRRIFGLADLYSCQMACVRENLFNCRSVSFDEKTKECYLASCDRYCGYENIDRYYTTYSERVTCGHDLRPIPFNAPNSIRPQLRQDTYQVEPNANTLPLQRFSEPVLGCHEGSGTKITFERTTGYAPLAIHRELLPTSRVRGVTQECVQQCIKLAKNCQAFVLIYLPPPSTPECLVYAQSTALQAALPETGQLQNKPDVVFFEKMCFSDVRCHKLWMFDRMFGYEFTKDYFMTYEAIETRQKCEDFCLRFGSYPCRSASYSAQTKTCRLNTESRHTNPTEFRYVGGDVQYLENQCTNNT